MGAHPTGGERIGASTGRAPLGPVAWRVATVRETRMEAPGVRTLVLDVPGWPGHVAGQHADVRLTAEDGYQAQRSYSIASAPESPDLELTVEELEDGEVSPYLVEDAQPGDRFELRGPIGGYFTWAADRGGPLLLVAGGSGVVPLMAMIRTRDATASDAETLLLLSSRGWEDVSWQQRLARGGVLGGRRSDDRARRLSCPRPRVNADALRSTAAMGPGSRPGKRPGRPTGATGGRDEQAWRQDVSNAQRRLA
jgi:ferredoxin-NADP reductase